MITKMHLSITLMNSTMTQPGLFFYAVQNTFKNWGKGLKNKKNSGHELHSTAFHQQNSGQLKNEMGKCKTLTSSTLHIPTPYYLLFVLGHLLC
jgi:hypothetical protein